MYIACTDCVDPVATPDVEPDADVDADVDPEVEWVCDPEAAEEAAAWLRVPCLLYTSPSPRD